MRLRHKNSGRQTQSLKAKWRAGQTLMLVVDLKLVKSKGLTRLECILHTMQSQCASKSLSGAKLRADQATLNALSQKFQCIMTGSIIVTWQSGVGEIDDLGVDGNTILLELLPLMSLRSNQVRESKKLI